MTSIAADLAEIFPACRSFLSEDEWQGLQRELSRDGGQELEVFPDLLAGRAEELGLPAFLEGLARLEAAMRQAEAQAGSLPGGVQRLTLNPTVRILELGWRGLADMARARWKAAGEPEPGAENVLVWTDPASGRARAQAASDRDLLALKIAAEGLDAGRTAAAHGVPAANVHAAVEAASRKGMLLAPEPLLRRDPEIFQAERKDRERFQRARVFTLQWHITQACDLNCKHCYDRSDRSRLEPDRAKAVLQELQRFCEARRVRGKITFTGGNPLIYPHFDEIYRDAVQRGFSVAILGNPAPKERLRALAAIQPPSFFQVSLEGLREYNDYIRQPGYFDRVMRFLDTLRELDIRSQVMLTLSRDNMDQVLPLGEALRDRADVFTFNRLSAVGEGARLLMPSSEGFESFLREYVQEAERNPVLGIKDNLINILRAEQGRKPFGGCTGFGCGAAFNFVALLPDGEVHACRKFPSWIGNLFETPLGEIYDSRAAEEYRSGSGACRGCSLRAACGGCQAVAYSCGLNPARDRDPYCFFSEAPPQ
jgi:selenobiotic family peptide radical SAM maturase